MTIFIYFYYKVFMILLRFVLSVCGMDVGIVSVFRVVLVCSRCIKIGSVLYPSLPKELYVVKSSQA